MSSQSVQGMGWEGGVKAYAVLNRIAWPNRPLKACFRDARGVEEGEGWGHQVLQPELFR